MTWIYLALILAATAAVVAWAIRLQANARRRMMEVWHAFATRHGWRWIEASGPWYRRKSSAIEGSLEGVELRLDTFAVRHGKSSVTYTRASAKLARRVHVDLEATWRNLFTLISEKLGRMSISTGSPEFDRMMYVRSGSQDFARTVLDDETRTRFLKIGRHPDIKVEEDLAKLTWRGAEKDPEVLEASARAVAALALACARV